MSTDDRPRRPPLDRSEPIRNWSQLLRPSPGSAGAAGPDHDGPGIGDVVSRSVELGYRVVDEYVRQGQSAAERIRAGEYGPASFGQDAQDLAQRMVQHASELATTWLQLLDRSPTPPVPPTSGASEPGPAASRNGGAPPRIRLEVSAAADCTVALELAVEASGTRLVTHDLRAADASKPRIAAADVRPGSADEPTLIRVAVPPNHPAGVYEGLVLDGDTNRPVGVVRVTVGRSG